MNKMIEKNRQKFEALKKLNLPMGQYAITGSGPLGIRNLREINDIDIIVNEELWNILAEKYGVSDKDGVKRVVFLEGLVEAMGQESFHTAKKKSHDPTIVQRIAAAEVLDGLPFESLEHVLYFKRKMGREKDLKDIVIIEAWRKAQQ